MRTYLKTTDVIAVAKKHIVDISEDIKNGFTIGIVNTDLIGENAILEVKRELGEDKMHLRIYGVYIKDDTLKDYESNYGKPLEIKGIGDLVKVEDYIIRNMKKVIAKEL